jgi:hypothetical protein
MPREVITLLRGDKTDAQTDFRDALPVNMSGVLRPILGAQGYMLQEPGLTAYGEASGADRGGTWNVKFQEHYRLSGTDFCSVAEDGTVTVIGTILNTDQASLPASFNTQAIIADGAFYLYDAVNGLRQVTDPDVGNPIDGVWIDGYYFLTDGNYLYHTDLDDEEAIDPLKYATSEFSPDPTVGVSVTTDDKVIAWNRYTTEYFSNEANEQFAFTRLGGRTVKYGLVGTHCKAEIGGEFFFMGGPKEGNISIYRLGVGSATNISSREVDKLIAQYTEAQLALCLLETRIVDNYPELIVRLPNETLKFNVTLAAKAGVENAWTLLSSSTANPGTYRAINGVFDPRRGQWVYGDTQGATLGYLDPTVATHYGAIAQWYLYTPLLYLEAVSLDELAVQIIPGHTATSDATVAISLTYDGYYYGSEAWLTYGAPSAYSQRFIARTLGYVRNYFGLRLRGASRSRMAFATASLTFS